MKKNNIITPTVSPLNVDTESIVPLFDKIRRELSEKDSKYAEFCWFAREFPRFYRYHINNIVHRLEQIDKLYQISQRGVPRKGYS